MPLIHETKAILKDLVAFDTTSRHSNLALIHYIRDYLSSFQVDSRLVFDKTNEKANLLATIGPDVEGGIIFSGHTDVVPVDGQDWQTPPFEMTEKEGKLYGRGTSDMKGFIATVLALVPVILKAGIRRPIHLSFTYDEEVGCLGVHSLVDCLKEHIQKPAFAVIGEPTEMRVIHAHKGISSFQTVVTGFEAHSSAVQKGVNAIAVAAELISFLNRRQKECVIKQAVDPVAQSFDPPYTTLHVGTIQGGTARNIIPKHCGFFWEVRTVPDDDAAEHLQAFEAFAQSLVPAMKQVSGEAGITTTPVAVVPGLKQNPDVAVEQLLLSLSGHNSAETVAFGTEAGIFQQKGGIPAIVCGPGSIMQAHKPNEFIEVDQLEKALAFLEKLVERQREVALS